MDGDTLICDSGQDTTGGRGRRLRLAGIDAPESQAPGGQEATRALERFLSAGWITYEVLDTDQYGRDIVTVLVNGVDVSYAMLTAGYAVAFMTDDEAYWQMQADAQRAGVGLWHTDAFDCLPWNWRQGLCM